MDSGERGQEEAEGEIITAGGRTDRPLRVCFVVRALPGHRLGGLEHHVRDLALALERRGHEIHILTTPGGRTGFFPCINYITDSGGGCRGDEDDLSFEDTQEDAEEGFTLGGAPAPQDGESITIHEVEGVARGNYSVGFFRKVAGAAMRVCEEHNVDVLCPIDMAGLFLDKRKFRAVVVPLIHGTMTSEVPLDWRYWRHLSVGEKLSAVWTYKARLALWPFFRRMVNRADGILVDSEFTRRELLTNVQGRSRSAHKEVANTRRLAELARRIHVAQLGIDSHWYPMVGPRYKQPEGPLKIGLLGRLQKIKGLEMAIRAAAGLRARGVDFVMTIGGRGSYEAEGKALVRELGLEEQVRFVGRVSPVVQTARFFEGQDVFLFPDLTQPAFGLVALEAMYYELPVVAARVGAVPEVVTEEVGWLYDAWDVNSLVDVLAEVSGDREMLRKKGWRGQEVCEEKYTADKMAERTEGAMWSIVGERITENGKRRTDKG